MDESKVASNGSKTEHGFLMKNVVSHGSDASGAGVIFSLAP